MSLFSLKGKCAVVTGGYGHLGSAMTEALLEAGADVFIFGRSREKFEDRFAGTPARFLQCDLMEPESIKEAVVELRGETPRLDILINNAISAPHWDPAAQKTGSVHDSWIAALRGGIVSASELTGQALPLLKAAGSASVINIGSMYGMVSPDFRVYTRGQIPSPDYYSAVKGGLIQWTRYLAVRHAREGIRVNCVSPGPFPKAAVYEDQEFISNLEGKVPMGRLGAPQDLKGIITLLASDSSRYITGQNIAVDGGWTSW